MSFRESYLGRRNRLGSVENTAQKIRMPTVPVIDKTGMAVLLLIGFNLNHLLGQATGITALLWPVLLLLLGILCLRYGSSNRITGVYVLYVASVSSYLLFATLTSLANAQIERILLASYFTTLVFVTGLYFWFVSQDGSQLAATIRNFKAILIVACVAILLSPLLAPYLNYTGGRASGLFENPNDASIAALCCLVLVIAYPAEHWIKSAAEALIAIIAVLLTFSKSGVLILLALVCVFVAQKRSTGGLLLGMVFLAALFWGIIEVSQSNFLSLSDSQRERVAAIPRLLAGEASEETTTGRSALWQLAWQRIETQLPWGAGLGKFHHIEGGYRNKNEWLGTHNFLLMILGEGGLAPFLLFVLFLVRLLTPTFPLRFGESTLRAGFIVILMGEMLSSHGLLGSRLANVALAVLMALAGRAQSQRNVG